METGKNREKPDRPEERKEKFLENKKTGEKKANPVVRQ